MVMGCLTASGVGSLQIIDVIISAAKHVNVLRGSLKKKNCAPDGNRGQLFIPTGQAPDSYGPKRPTNGLRILFAK